MVNLAEESEKFDRKKVDRDKAKPGCPKCYHHKTLHSGGKCIYNCKCKETF
jgi:hypothetical protein